MSMAYICGQIPDKFKARVGSFFGGNQEALEKLAEQIFCGYLQCSGFRVRPLGAYKDGTLFAVEGAREDTHNAMDAIKEQGARFLSYSEDRESLRAEMAITGESPKYFLFESEQGKR